MSIVTMLSLASLAFSGVVLSQATPEAATTVDCPTTSEAENIALAEQWLDAFAAGDVDAYRALVVDEHVHHWGQGPDTTHGVDAFEETLQVFITAFPERDMEIEEVIAQGDLVAVRWTQTAASHDGPFFGIEATGNTVAWTGINVFRITCGQIAESWSEVDALGMREQMNALPVPATHAD
jgi:steroid delta-isomerase-like uncharacterized protein